jgi:hypothetical protein
MFVSFRHRHQLFKSAPIKFLFACFVYLQIYIVACKHAKIISKDTIGRN